MNILQIRFDDFKRLAEDRRVYVYEGDNFFDFHYLVDGIIVKTTVLKELITNPEAFFSDRLFYGFIRVDNRLVPDNNSLAEFVPLKVATPVEETPIIQSEEDKRIDIQKEGVQ